MDLRKIIKRILKEATSDGGGRGSYAPPLQPGMKDFDDSQLGPFTVEVSKYKSPLVAYDSYDHKFDLKKNEIKKLETRAKKVSNYLKYHPEATFTDEDGGIINQTPSGNLKKTKKEIVPIERKKLNEISTTTSAGEYNGPQELGLRIWKNSELGPFSVESKIKVNQIPKKKTTKKNVKRIVGVWEKDKSGKYEIPTYPVGTTDEETITEDLAVWFGKKKKPKGSSQPKGPWVDICRKVDGKHPPCGRSDASTGSYPKCRAAGVAGKMSDSQKKAACQQKRKAEKNDPQSGKGQKPVMTSYKTRKESIDSIISKVLLEFRNSI